MKDLDPGGGVVPCAPFYSPMMWIRNSLEVLSKKITIKLMSKYSPKNQLYLGLDVLLSRPIKRLMLVIMKNPEYATACTKAKRQQDI